MCLNISACPKKEVHVLYRNTFITRFLRLFVPKSTSIVFVPKLLFRKLRGIAVHPTSLCAKSHLITHFVCLLSRDKKRFLCFKKDNYSSTPSIKKLQKCHETNFASYQNTFRRRSSILNFKPHYKLDSSRGHKRDMWEEEEGTKSRRKPLLNFLLHY